MNESAVLEVPAGVFAPIVEPLVAPHLAQLADQLAASGLDSDEQQAVMDATGWVVRAEAWRRVSRVLVTELNAARVSGQLTAATPEQRWQQWLDSATADRYWDSLADRYPALLPRLRPLLANRCAASASLAARFAADRALIAALTGAEPRLVKLTAGEGDRHRGGQTVMTLELVGGRVVYKPRPLDVDRELGRLLPQVLPHEPATTRIRVPEVVCRDGYGWSEFVAHRYCDGDAELRAFYRGIGHWLAMTRLLSANDIHSENLIAAGPVPVVVDCESLFAPQPELPPTGIGLAVDRAIRLVNGSVLRTGLLPLRAQALGLRGADISATGRLPGQQPEVSAPTIVGAGTDEAHLAITTVPLTQTTTNHPSPEPALDQHWPAVLDGFVELTERLTGLDSAGRLDPLLAPFRDCQIRVITRDTVIYGELTRMLWHPVSLHRQARARRRAVDVLIRHGQSTRLGSVEPAVIDAEVSDLLVGDVPTFTTRAGDGRLFGPGGVTATGGQDLVGTALRRWRDLDPAIDQLVTRGAVVSAYFNAIGFGRDRAETDPTELDRRPVVPTGPPTDPRRRELAAAYVRRIAEHALRAEDGTATWIAPVLDATGWRVRPLPADFYSGLAGVAVALAAYQAEAAAGRADPVPELPDLLAATLQTIRNAEDLTAPADQPSSPGRPEPPGGYVGLASRVAAWLLLARFGAVTPAEAARRGKALATPLPEAVAADDRIDVLTGMAGAIVPLLGLAELTGEQPWQDLAGQIGDQLAQRATRCELGARWRATMAPDGLGGFAHGATGIGWALRKLAAATGQARHQELAEAAFAYETSLFDPELGGWRDVRKQGIAAAWWCHGSVGIGLVAADRLADEPGQREPLRHAAALTWRAGMDATHTLCHGDLGCWELLSAAVAAGVAPAGLDQSTLDSYVLTSLETHGPRCNVTADVFVPGLLHGLAGIVYQLLRMHPEHALPSVLLPDPGGPPAG